MKLPHDDLCSIRRQLELIQREREQEKKKRTRIKPTNLHPDALSSSELERLALEKDYSEIRDTHLPHVRQTDWPIVFSWLWYLPEEAKAEKIVRRLLEVAGKQGIRLESFRWWDIQQRPRHLFATAEGLAASKVDILFIWKKTPQKSERKHDAIPFPGNIRWAFDGPNKRRLEIEDETFWHVARAFPVWLRAYKRLQTPKRFSSKQLSFAV